MVGLMVAQPNIDRAMDDLREVRAGYAEEMVQIKNTAFSVEDAGYNSTNKELSMVVRNTGAASIDPSDVDVLVDGTIATVSSGPTGPIYPGGSGTILVKVSAKPSSVMVSGPYGIAVSIGKGAIADG